MKTFKEFMVEAQTGKAAFKKPKGKGKEYEIKNAGESAFKGYRDVKNDIVIQPSVHAASQAKDRRPEFSEQDWKQLHKKTAQKIDDDGLYDDGWKLFYSKSMQQGYICVLKFNDGSGILNVKVVTVLPKGKNNPQGGNSGGTTELELMESLVLESLTLEDIKIYDMD